MPNWVYTSVKITGSTNDVENFYAKACAIHPEKFDTETNKVVYTTDLEFSFWNFVAPPEKKLDEYFGVHGFVDGKSTGDTKYNWYNWNNKKWGCKWDAGDVSGETTINKDGTSELSLSYSTPWSIPEPVMSAMVKQHPELNFEFYCEEETGWGAEYVGENGEFSMTKDWNEPASHSDYVERDNEDGCACSWSDDEDDWYSDCPRQTKEFFVEITRTYKVIAENPEQAWELSEQQVNSGLVVDEFSTIIVKDENGVRLYPIPETDK